MATASHRPTGTSFRKAANKNASFKVDPGPYEATVTGHVEGSRMGQLVVSIPELKGIVTTNELTVTYASPFYGTTYGTDSQQLPDGPFTAGQSYGMWMVPPDIGAKVLVIFVAGDMDRGYWFACCYDSSSHHMVPGISRAIGGSNYTNAPTTGISADSSSVLPVVEYSTEEKTAFNSDGLEKTPRYTHEAQAAVLVNQGLDRDPVRGAISSSSMRESPSNVYGISTPGRKVSKGDQVPGAPQVVFARKGGHSFVMDDGDADGKDQLMRFRTTGGHQILMNDTENILYIASASGRQWLEFSNNGQINVYGAAGFNLRTEGVLNLHSDVLLNLSAPNIKMTAVGSKTVPLGSISMATSGNFSASAVGLASLKCNGALSLSAMGKVSVSAGGWLSMSSLIKTSINGTMLTLNSGAPLPPLPVLPPTPNFKTDTILAGNKWVSGGIIATGCTVVPAHEPWLDSGGKRPKK
jgi:hypothetical protein